MVENKTLGRKFGTQRERERERGKLGVGEICPTKI
jgi:hypothetical protein